MTILHEFKYSKMDWIVDYLIREGRISLIIWKIRSTIDT